MQLRVLSESEWRERVRVHKAILEKWLGEHVHRHNLHQKHPIYDFLFQYYRFRPAQLLNGSMAELY